MKKQKKPVPSAEAEPVIKKQPLLKRLLFGPERPDLSELEAGSTTILDILSPTAIDTKSRDYIVVDGVFHAYLYITGYGYSTTVGSCWLAPLVEAGEGVNVSFSFTRQNREKILSKIAQTTMLNRSRMRDVGDTRQDYEELDSAITSGLYLKDVMNRQGEDFYYMHTLIEVVADDPDTLEQRVTAVEKLCVSVDMIARRCDYANEQGFLSTLPLVTLDADIERKSRRNALTTGVAAAFPFVSYEHSDRNGIFLGLNLYNKSPVFLDPYDDYKYTNGNWWIGGNSGAGKSSILNALDPAMSLKTGEISQALGRGRHTTRHVELYELPCGAEIIDTPGFSSFETTGLNLALKEHLPECFPDFTPYLGDCRFVGCSHTKEKGCAVREAVKDRKIVKGRHESYCRLYDELKDLREWNAGTEGRGKRGPGNQK